MPRKELAKLTYILREASVAIRGGRRDIFWEDHDPDGVPPLLLSQIGLPLLAQVFHLVSRYTDFFDFRFSVARHQSNVLVTQGLCIEDSRAFGAADRIFVYSLQMLLDILDLFQHELETAGKRPGILFQKGQAKVLSVGEVVLFLFREIARALSFPSSGSFAFWKDRLGGRDDAISGGSCFVVLEA